MNFMMSMVSFHTLYSQYTDKVNYTKNNATCNLLARPACAMFIRFFSFRLFGQHLTPWHCQYSYAQVYFSLFFLVFLENLLQVNYKNISLLINKIEVWIFIVILNHTNAIERI